MNANELADNLNDGDVSYITMDKAATMLRQQQAEIEALKAEIVAIEKNTDYWADKSARTLTDEEITDIASTLLIATDSIEYEWGVCVVEFARAILRKAQEADKIESLGTVNIGGVHYRNGKPEKWKQ